MSESRTPQKRGTFWQALLLTGLIAGTLDALSAIIDHTIQGGRQPARIFRYIASGVFGKEARSGGTDMVVYGVLFHYFIAYCFTTAFFLLYPRLAFLRRNPWISGLGYGLIIWLVMNLIVVPLSCIGTFPSHWLNALKGMGILIIAIGLPVSFLARAWIRPSLASPQP